MAVTGAPWQLECDKMEQRCGYLLTSGQWADCTFMVGSATNQTAVPAHKLLLAMSSPVFEAMFYGGLSEPNDPVVQISDVQPEAFSALLQCKEHAAHAIYNISCSGSPSQLRVLAEAAALQLFCRLLAATDDSCESVLCGLDNLLENVEENTQLALLQKLREFGVPQLLITVQGDSDDEQNRELADSLLQTYFSGGQ